MTMLEKYDEFTQRKKQIDNQQALYKKKIAGLKKKKLELQKQKIHKQMNKFTNGSSGYSNQPGSTM